MMKAVLLSRSDLNKPDFRNLAFSLQCLSALSPFEDVLHCHLKSFKSWSLCPFPKPKGNTYHLWQLIPVEFNDTHSLSYFWAAWDGLRVAGYAFIWFGPEHWPKLLASLVAQTVKNLLAMQETQVWFLGWEDPLEKEMAIHSGVLTWRISWTEEPGGLQFMGSQRAGYFWATNTFTCAFFESIGLYSEFVCV